MERVLVGAVVAVDEAPLQEAEAMDPVAADRPPRKAMARPMTMMASLVVRDAVGPPKAALLVKPPVTPILAVPGAVSEEMSVPLSLEVWLYTWLIFHPPAQSGRPSIMSINGVVKRVAMRSGLGS